MFQWVQVSIVTTQPDKKMGNIKRILSYDRVVDGPDIFDVVFTVLPLNTGALP
jgi:hypothetical protein